MKSAESKCDVSTPTIRRLSSVPSSCFYYLATRVYFDMSFLREKNSYSCNQRLEYGSVPPKRTTQAASFQASALSNPEVCL